MRNPPTSVLVVGAGPAGITCASHLAKMGVKVDLADQSPTVGGAVRRFWHDDIWVPIPGLTANALIAGFRSEVRHPGLRMKMGRYVATVEERESAVLANGCPYAAIVLATGAVARGLAQARQGVIVGAGADLESVQVGSMRIAVCGGGDNAFENAARMLRSGAASVDVFSRGKPRARPHLIEAAQAAGARLVVGPYEIEDRRVVRVGVPNGSRDFDLISVLWGYETRLPVITSRLRSMPKVLPVGPRPLRRLWIIGDARPDQERAILVAMGDGARAAREVEAFLRDMHAIPDGDAKAGAVCA